MIYLALVAAWFVTGLVVALVMARRGHHVGAWIGLAVFGPFAIPLAVQAAGYESSVEVHGRRPRPPGEGVRLLIGVDGSPESRAAALQSLRLLGPRLGSVTIAEVVDYDTGREPATSPDRSAASETLSRLTTELEATTAAVCESVVLVGRPADALLQYAHEEQCDLIAIGSRGRGASRRVLGSVAEHFATRADIPVLLSAVESTSPSGAESAD